MCGDEFADMAMCSFHDRADTKIRFEIEVDAVNRWRVLDWMCLDGLLIQIT